MPEWLPLALGSLVGLAAFLNAILVYRRGGQTVDVGQQDSVTKRLQLDLDTLKGQIALYEVWVKGIVEQLKSKDAQIQSLIIERDAAVAELKLCKTRMAQGEM